MQVQQLHVKWCIRWKPIVFNIPLVKKHPHLLMFDRFYSKVFVLKYTYVFRSNKSSPVITLVNKTKGFIQFRRCLSIYVSNFTAEERRGFSLVTFPFNVNNHDIRWLLCGHSSCLVIMKCSMIHSVDFASYSEKQRETEQWWVTACIYTLWIELPTWK